jgi:MFS transporter, PPP family, 3-phenylpropionic acid transporter
LRRAAFAYFVITIGFAAYLPFLSLYYQSLDIPLAWIGALLALGWTASLVSGPAWGAVHDRFPASMALLPLAGLIAGISALGLGLVGASPLLTVFAVCLAVGGAGLMPMLDVRALELAGSDRTRYGHVRAFSSISFIIFAPITGFLTNARGAGAIFAIIVPSMIVAGFIAATVPGRSNVARAQSMLRAPGRVIAHRTTLVFLVGSLICWTAINAQAGFFSIYLQSLGAPADQVGWAWALQALLEVPTMLLFPILARRFGLSRLIVVGAVIAVVREVANATFTVPAILLACSVMEGAAYALLLVGGITFVSIHGPKDAAATAQGLFSAAAVSLSAILGVGLGGVLAEGIGTRGLYWVTVVLGVIGLAAIAVSVLPPRGAVPFDPDSVPAGTVALTPNPAAPPVLE